MTGPNLCSKNPLVSDLKHLILNWHWCSDDAVRELKLRYPFVTINRPSYQPEEENVYLESLYSPHDYDDHW